MYRYVDDYEEELLEEIKKKKYRHPVETNVMTLAIKEMKQLSLNENKSDQIQTKIHPEIFTRYNSINLLIGKRGSGKTHSVLQEILAICHLDDCAGYRILIIVSDQPDDSTINKVIPALESYGLKIIRVDYDGVLGLLKEVIEGKLAYSQVIRKHLESKLQDESREEILNLTGDYDFLEKLPHSFILFDDAVNIFTLKKYEPLQNLLYRNRQPRFTIFICIQDITGIPTIIRRNADSCWLFAGMRDKTTFSRILTQFHPISNNTLKTDIYIKYNKLSPNGCIRFDTYDNVYDIINPKPTIKKSYY
jgi:hypothetical protein